MARAKWCVLCGRNVVPRKRFNWVAFILLLGIFYLPFYWLQRPHCPICGGTRFERARATN